MAGTTRVAGSVELTRDTDAGAQRSPDFVNRVGAGPVRQFLEKQIGVAVTLVILGVLVAFQILKFEARATGEGPLPIRVLCAKRRIDVLRPLNRFF